MKLLSALLGLLPLALAVPAPGAEQALACRADCDASSDATALLQRRVEARAKIFSAAPLESGPVAGDDVSFAVAFADVDADGDADMLVTNSESANRLYLNDGRGNFEDATEDSGLADADALSRGVAFADFDGDGNLDVFISSWNDSNKLFLGDGTGRFTDLTVAAGLADNTNSQGVCLADIDNDGDIDIFVANYGQSNRLYLNGGTSHSSDSPVVFSDATKHHGLESGSVNGFGCAFGDFDQDGDQDLYVNNDGSLNTLYVNGGTGIFADGTGLAHAAGNKGMGRAIETADFDGDGDMDIYIVNVFGPNVMLRNTAGSFVDDTEAAGVSGKRATEAGFAMQGAKAADIDGDGDVDIIVSVLHGHQLVFENDGTGHFKDISASAMSVDNIWGQGIAFADVNSDGALDAYVASYGNGSYCQTCESKNSLLINQLDVPAWLKVRPLRAHGASPLGAEVRVFEAGTHTLAAASARIDGGSGFSSQNAYEAYFGLSASAARNVKEFDIEVRCGGLAPNGSFLVSERKGVSPNQVVDVLCPE